MSDLKTQLRGSMAHALSILQTVHDVIYHTQILPAALKAEAINNLDSAIRHAEDAQEAINIS